MLYNKSPVNISEEYMYLLLISQAGHPLKISCYIGTTFFSLCHHVQEPAFQVILVSLVSSTQWEKRH